MKDDVRKDALYHVNSHLSRGNFSTTQAGQFDMYESVVWMVQQIMAIESPDSVVVRESPKITSDDATTHAYGLMLDHLRGLNRLRDLCSARGLLWPRMIVLKMDDSCPANNAIGLVYVPRNMECAPRGVVVWISRQLEVTVMRVRALPSFCDGYQQQELSAARVERQFGTGFNTFVLSNLSVLVGSLGEARNRLQRSRYDALAG